MSAENKKFQIIVKNVCYYYNLIKRQYIFCYIKILMKY